METVGMKLQAAFHDVVGTGAVRSVSVTFRMAVGLAVGLAVPVRFDGAGLGLLLGDYLEAAFLDQHMRQAALDLTGELRTVRRRVYQGERSDLDAAPLRREDGAVRRGPVLEDGNVAALAKQDAHTVFPALRAVILFELGAQAAGLHANDGIDARIEGLPPVEDLEPNDVLLEPMRLAEQALFDNELEKTADAMGLNERAAAENQIELGLDIGRGDAVQRRRGLFRRDFC